MPPFIVYPKRHQKTRVCIHFLFFVLSSEPFHDHSATKTELPQVYHRDGPRNKQSRAGLPCYC